MDYRKTIRACFAGYIVQAVVNNFLPLLFVTIRAQYGIPLSRVTLLITFNFALQLVTDFASAFFVDRIGYRASALLAHGLAAAGIASLAVLPELLPDPFIGFMASAALYAVGGGLLEVIVSPIVEACPSRHKAKTMSMLHSFYCWGCVGVTGLSTLFFALFGVNNWRGAALLWALLPIANGLLFLRAPIPNITAEGGDVGFFGLLRSGRFLLFVVLMCCAGASEQSVSQWASAFSETGLGVSKTVGDLAGPMAFSVLMGASRAFYGKFGNKIDLDKFMIFSSALCVMSYLCASLIPSPAAGLAGCAVCGLSVGILWPGTFSKAAAGIKNGGTAMFALLALAGDLGCAGGPTLAGFVSSAAGGNLRAGILGAVVFPLLMLICLLIGDRRGGNQNM